jgi:hypothetical protein
MRRDLEPIELPPPAQDPGARGVDDHTSTEPDDLGNQPIDDLDAGIDPEHLGAPGQGVKVEAEPDRPGIDQRGPVQQPGPTDPEMDRRSKLSKTIDPMGGDPTKTVDPEAKQPRGWQEPGR